MCSLNRKTDCDQLGPLPQSAPEHELERIGLQAFQGFLSDHPYLIPRDERLVDYGVDLSLEVVSDGRPTNCRAQAQLKSSTSPKYNQDGSTSVSITVANLNYLLNGRSPIYILYIKDTEEFRYAWAQDEAQRLGDRWREQSYVTLRLADKMEPSTLGLIRDRILREGRLRRQIDESLTRNALTRQIDIRIDIDSGDITDSKQAYKSLTDQGLQAVALGMPDKVLEAARLIDKEDRKDPRVPLVSAYAYYSMGRYHDAMAQLAQLSTTSMQLEEDDLLLANYILSACARHMGQTTAAEYQKEIETLGRSATGDMAADLELEDMRMRAITAGLAREGIPLLDQLIAKARKIVDDPSTSSPRRIHTHLTMLDATSLRLTADWLQLLMLMKIRSRVGLDEYGTLAPAIRTHIEAVVAWVNEVSSVVNEAVKAGHMLFVAEGLRIRAQGLIWQARQQKMLDMAHGETYTAPSELVGQLRQDCEKAARAFQQIDILEGELRARLLMADVHDLVDDFEAAKEIALEVAPLAKAWSCAGVEAHAAEYLGNRSAHSEFVDSMRLRTRHEKDREYRKHSDEMIRRFASDTITALGLPQDRLGNIKKDYLAERDFSNERLLWCQHLFVIQDLRHTLDKSTFYTVDPDRGCYCKRFSYRTLIVNPDHKVVLDAFKAARCRECSFREPFEPDGTVE